MCRAIALIAAALLPVLLNGQALAGPSIIPVQRTLSAAAGASTHDASNADHPPDEVIGSVYGLQSITAHAVAESYDPLMLETVIATGSITIDTDISPETIRLDVNSVGNFWYVDSHMVRQSSASGRADLIVDVPARTAVQMACAVGGCSNLHAWITGEAGRVWSVVGVGMAIEPEYEPALILDPGRYTLSLYYQTERVVGTSGPGSATVTLQVVPEPIGAVVVPMAFLLLARRSRK